MIIAIITSYSDSLGMGHIQRMTSLAWYLNEYKNIEAFLISKNIPDSFPSELYYCLKNDIDFSPDLIIRDMRDSSEEEIASLKKICKVLVIDDNGTGRRFADSAIDILPNLKQVKEGLQYNNFLYGYNFFKSLSRLKGIKIKKELDFSIYPGNSASNEYIDFLSDLLPKESSYAILKGRNSYLIKKGYKKSLEETSHAEIILSSKAIISHFGITLYEGYISKCRLISINPTKYHSNLSDLVREDLKLINLGEYSKINKYEVTQLIKKINQFPLCKIINPGDVYEKIIDGLEDFFKLLMSI